MLVPVNDTPTPTPVNTPTPTHQTVIKGDVNGDGEVNSIDYGYVKMYLLGMINKFPTDDPNVGYSGADIDSDGDVDSIDFALLKRMLLGIN